MVLVGRSAQRSQVLATAHTSAGVDTMLVADVADVADAATPQSVASAALERFGRVDGLVNVAAATIRATLFEDTLAHVDSQMNINVKAPYFMIQAVARELVVQRSSGSIVNVGSTSGHGGQTKLTAYCMSKAALTVMTKNLAFGLMGHGIRINQVNPGWMETESEDRIQVEEDGAPENWLELAASTSTNPCKVPATRPCPVSATRSIQRNNRHFPGGRDCDVQGILLGPPWLVSMSVLSRFPYWRSP
jgi:NAD(P)-dependent dehydrogenase (short-subunit alcohol dehydrogenase family)